MIDYSLLLKLTTPQATKVKGLTFRKEVIYVGTFSAPQPDGSRQTFSVDKADLEHWRKSVELQLENGILVDVPIGHTTNPEASRGKVVGAEVDKNSRGEDALFLHIEFADAQAAKLAKTTQVSIFSPPSWTDGTGKTYTRPLRHVALTQQPVIPKLDAFTLIASLEGDFNTMDALKAICDAVGIEYSDTDDEATLQQLIIDAFNEGADEDPTEGEDPELDQELGDEDPLLEDEEDEEEETALSLSLGVRKQLIEGRKARIGLLLSERRITPAQHKHLTGKYCGTTLKLSDDFDSVVKTLSLGDQRHTGSRTGAQLPKNGDNPLRADAERRAKSQKG